MNLNEFTESLLMDGSAVIGEWQPISAAEVQQTEKVLLDFEIWYQQDLPEQPPPIDLPSAIWAARIFYRSSQLTAIRDLNKDVVERELSEPPPNNLSNANVHYSVDLCMRFLPDLFRIASTIARDDPLVLRLLEFCQSFPLSSIGVTESNPELNQNSLDVVLGDMCLRRMYVDRVIRHGDTTRINHPQVRDALLAANGPAELANHQLVAPSLIAAIHNQTPNVAEQDQHEPQ